MSTKGPKPHAATGCNCDECCRFLYEIVQDEDPSMTFEAFVEVLKPALAEERRAAKQRPN